MKRNTAHAIFTGILICSLAWNLKTANGTTALATPEAAILHVAQSQGLTLREQSAAYHTDYLYAFVFEVPGCSQPLRVMLRSLSLAEEPIAQVMPGYVRRYLYIERSWDAPRRAAIWLERAKYGVLALFGGTRYVASGQLLQVELPPRCDAANAIEWRMVWDHDYLAAMADQTKSMTR
jgi:hypothetical protein